MDGNDHMAVDQRGVLVAELEAAITRGTNQRRNEMLTRVTDLFIGGAGRFSDEKIELFDDVMMRLALATDASARSMLARRLASADRVPFNVARQLAKDDDIMVANPILVHSDRLDDDSLLQIASSKGQEHLLAIAQRKTVTDSVVEVLIERGNIEVLQALADNRGAKLSETAIAQLVNRSTKDDALATSVGSRPEIPHHLFQKLLTISSEVVRAKFIEVNLPVKVEFSCVEPHFVFAGSGQPLLAA